MMDIPCTFEYDLMMFWPQILVICTLAMLVGFDMQQGYLLKLNSSPGFPITGSGTCAVTAGPVGPTVATVLMPGVGGCAALGGL